MYTVHGPVSYTHLRAHETGRNLVCRLLLESVSVVSDHRAHRDNHTDDTEKEEEATTDRVLHKPQLELFFDSFGANAKRLT